MKEGLESWKFLNIYARWEKKHKKKAQCYGGTRSFLKEATGTLKEKFSASHKWNKSTPGNLKTLLNSIMLWWCKANSMFATSSGPTSSL